MVFSRQANRARARKQAGRADRVLDITPHTQEVAAHPDFDVRKLLDRNWLKAAMQQWAQEAPVRICLSRQQAERLEKDWYYQHAIFEHLAEDRVLMTFGEEDRHSVAPGS